MPDQGRDGTSGEGKPEAQHGTLASPTRAGNVTASPGPISTGHTEELTTTMMGRGSRGPDE
jgi:hypothetical protein